MQIQFLAFIGSTLSCEGLTEAVLAYSLIESIECSGGKSQQTNSVGITRGELSGSQW